MEITPREMEWIKGNRYIIDKGFRNSGEVILVDHGKRFCRVRDPDNGEEWDTMLYRLSEIEQLDTSNQPKKQ